MISKHIFCKWYVDISAFFPYPIDAQKFEEYFSPKHINLILSLEEWLLVVRVLNINFSLCIWPNAFQVKRDMPNSMKEYFQRPNVL